MSGNQPTDRAQPTDESVRAALATVQDPDIRRPITELGMVESIVIRDDGQVAVGVLLTVLRLPAERQNHCRRDRGRFSARRV